MKEGDRWEKGFVRQEINRSKTKRESFIGSKGLKGVDVGKIKKKINETHGIDMSSPKEFKDTDMERNISGPGTQEKIKRKEYDDMFGDK